MSDIRRKALTQRLEMGLALDELIPAERVLDACAAATGLMRFQEGNLPSAEDRLLTAHHFAHAWLHGGKCLFDAGELNPLGNGESAALSKVEGDSPRRRPASEANLFASELHLPGPAARRAFLDEGLSAETIAQSLGLPVTIVEWQLMDSVLLPPLRDKPPRENKPAVPLDSFQQQAAAIEHGPLLLGAGPGTGKTKTLIGRCQFLTQTLGVPAEKILALTFSRQAAQEMRERLALSGVGTRDASPWVGTFHGFGLDILRRFGDRLGLPAGIKLLDTLDAVTLLENHLPQLQLDALDNLYNPSAHLGGIIKQISRAKDELCPPARYAELCESMQAQAEQLAAEMATKPGKKLKKDAEAAAHALLQAARAREVAHCYGVYETLLMEAGFLDFADLISHTVGMLESCPNILAALQAEYPHVLADEYQDVNRACARLVKLLAGDDARGLWAVGDHRQSIYRFRGASPANVAAFERDYPGGRRLELGINYRSRTPIVELLGTAAQGMEETPGTGASHWHAERGTDTEAAFPAVTLATAPDEAGQADGIARTIEELRAAGKLYREQAILCRTHGQAETLTARLSGRGIPALYLGPLLERPEIKDLLCLLSLMTDQDASGLLRVAAWPEYHVSQADTLDLLARIEREQMPLLEALQDDTLPDGLRKLGAHLAELNTMESDPAVRLRHYLFGSSQFLRRLYDQKPNRFLWIQQGLAIHQLLSLAATFDKRLISPAGQVAGEPNKVCDFLTHLRRMLAAGETLRGVEPPESEAIDAVRVLTAHAAKGLEYPVVFLPNLGAGQFPARGRHDGIPEPLGLADAAGQDADEEDCLFFVALSRARDYLIISRSETSGTDRTIQPSPLLSRLQPWFAARGVVETLWPAGRIFETSGVEPNVPNILPIYTASALELYERCPRQYYYGHVLNLKGLFPLGGYPQFHACIRQTLDWLDDERAAGRDPAREAVEAKQEAVWAAHGPVGHLHEEKYRDSARRMLLVAQEEIVNRTRQAESRTFHVTLPSCRVRVRPDVVHLAAPEGPLVVARRLTGRPGDEDKNDKRLALYRRAAQETHPDRPLRLELHYLYDGTAVEVEPPPTEYKAKLEADRVAKYDTAAQGIRAERFPARRGDVCQTCAYALICPL